MTTDERKELLDLCRETRTDPAMVTAHFKVTALEEVPYAEVKTTLLKKLAHIQKQAAPDTAESLVARTFGRIEILCEGASLADRDGIRGLVVNFEPMIAGFVDAGDLAALRYTLNYLESSVRASISGRRYDMN